MKFRNTITDVFVPDGKSADEALKRTTQMGFGAHQDDIEILAFRGILECLYSKDQWFTGVTCTDGAGSPRAGAYAGYTNEEMQVVRWQEQRTAASIGRYSAIIQLKYPSSAVKDPQNKDVAGDIRDLLLAARPSVVYTHNLADKHDTHIGVATKVIAALRSLPADQRPKKVYGVEIWRSLDWMPDKEKVVLDATGAEHMAAALLGVFDSQIAGGKRYDLATLGRWRANATYLESHGVDTAQHSMFAMDLTPIIENDKLDVTNYVTGYIDKLREDVKGRLEKFLPR
jgi:LmbE family N-acetylglucosaminyl deacetylase